MSQMPHHDVGEFRWSLVRIILVQALVLGSKDNFFEALKNFVSEDEDCKFANTVAPAFICSSLSSPLTPLSNQSFHRPISVVPIPSASDPAPI
jgi:hypothetical protein